MKFLHNFTTKMWSFENSLFSFIKNIQKYTYIKKNKEKKRYFKKLYIKLKS